MDAPVEKDEKEDHTDAEQKSGRRDTEIRNLFIDAA
jgi:hypothetical protein